MVMPLAIDTAQLGLQMQMPDRWFATLGIALQKQALSYSCKCPFRDRRPVEWALCLDGRRLRARHTGCAEQCPTSVVSGKRFDHTLDTRDQAQALTGEAEAARHGGDPSEIQTPAYTPSGRTVKTKVTHIFCG